MTGLLPAVLATAATQLDGIKTIDARTPIAAQIALAESAGPPIAAPIYVLGTTGYTKVRTGNGFMGIVSRERPDTMEPECFDAVGPASVVPVRLFIEERRAAGVAEDRLRNLDRGDRICLPARRATNVDPATVLRGG